ncbi:MAG: autotransporter-associated beta strand repeat-containing protein, partial [Chthoniobacterales bacterium]|nr:autotransporter-associated beta strand repeat-containing protein [Chthoniobacterales bacterium]
LTVSNEVVVGRESGTGILNVNGGTITTLGNDGNMYIGRRNGTGTLNQSNGVIIVNKEFGVGTRDDNKIGTGTYNLSGGSLTASNNIFIGKEQGSSGTMSMTGGTMSTSDKLQIGHNQATGVLTQSGGTVNVQNEVYIGNENNASSVGTYTLSGTGALNVGNEVIVGRDNGTGTLNLNGGTVTATKISGGNGSATVNFNGGVLKAKRDEANLIENLDTANVQSNGLKINSNGFNVASSQVFTGPGGLEKLGSGSLTLSGASTYNGTTTVTMGTLNLNNTGGQALGSTGSVSVASGATLLISASNQVNDGGSVTLSGGTIARATGVSETFQNLILTESSFLNFGTTESAGSFNFGTFTPTDTKVLTFLNFQINNSVSFSAASPLSMTFFAAGSGSLGLQGTMTGLSTFTITAIPEPSTVVAALGLSALLGWPVIRRRMRRRGRN